MRARTRIFERGLLVEDIEIAAAGSEATFYVRHGDVFAWSCWLAGAAALAAARLSPLARVRTAKR